MLAAVALSGWAVLASQSLADANRALADASLAADTIGQATDTLVEVEQVRDATAQVDGKLGEAMRNSLDVASLVDSILAAAPDGVTVDRLSINITAATGGDALPGGLADVGNLDRSGAQHVGTVDISATSEGRAGLPDYIDALKQVTGVFEPYPSASDQHKGKSLFSLRLILTDTILTGQGQADG